jgi:hypothetical protein
LSVLKFTQVAPHRSKPTSHTQAPALQIIDVPHAVAQSLQCIESDIRLTQLAPHLVSPMEQVAEHTPRSQTSVAAQATPHAPQFFASMSMLTQLPPHDTSPVEQVVAPPSPGTAASFTAWSAAWSEVSDESP